MGDQRSEKAERIISAAADLFAAYGVVNISRHDIARAADVTVRSVSTVGEHRSDLLREVVERLPDAEVARRYPGFRWQILEATFIGYATYYLVRNNLSVVAKDLTDALHYDKAMLGNLAWLQQNGHAKWKSVAFDPAALATLDRLSPCVAELLKAK